MKITEIEIGKLINLEKYQVFFGNKYSSINQIEKFFPNIKIRKIKQIHGDTIVNSTEQILEADAHYTSSVGNGLAIYTADCLPIFIFSSDLNIIAAIHAGWRGIANKISLKTVFELNMLGCNNKNMSIFVGPHILQKSFEVDEVTKNLIMQNVSSSSENLFQNNSGKYQISLESVLKSQLIDIGFSNNQFYSFSHDTKSDLNFHSYRRDKENSGRQISFIVLK